MKKLIYSLVILVLIVQLIVAAPIGAAAQEDQPQAPGGAIRYVKALAAGDCSAWRRACSLRRALNDASPGDEIWVTGGTYQPDFWTDLTSFTFAAWVYWNGGAAWQRIFDFGTDTANYLMMTPLASTGDMRFEIKSGGVSQVIDYPGSLAVGAWSHVAVTLYGDAGALYLNGVPQTGVITFDPREVVGDNLWLGKSAYTQDPYLNGKVDEVVIFNRALSQADIQALISSGWEAFGGKVLALHLDGSPASNGTILANSFENGSGGTLRTNDGTLDKTTAGALENALSFDGANDYIDLKPRREGTFLLKSGVALYGGFSGDETARSQRDPAANVTILSGDLLDNDGAGFINYEDNVYHAVTGSGADATAILDGFTIRGGDADGEHPHDRGGGICIYSGRPTLANLIITGNAAERFGGGMANYASSPSLNHVTFSGNKAKYYGSSGGGMYNDWYSSPTLSEVIFIGNYANDGGGGMYNQDHSNPTLVNVSFSANSADFLGGGMFNRSSSPVLTGVTFSGNASGSGGGMYNANSSSPTLINVTFSGNSATYNGGGMFSWLASNPVLTNVTISGNTAGWAGGGLYSLNNSTPGLINSIVWGNTALSNPQISGSASISYSDIQGGWTGEGNLSADPLLGALADNGGFTRTHALGVGSPAIDAGSPTTCPASDQRGVARPIDGDLQDGSRCDMGAVEFEPGQPLDASNQLKVFLPLVKR